MIKNILNLELHISKHDAYVVCGVIDNKTGNKSYECKQKIYIYMIDLAHNNNNNDNDDDDDDAKNSKKIVMKQ